METIDNVIKQTTSREMTGLVAASNAEVLGFNPADHWHEKLHDGTLVLIRPMHKDDAALERDFLERLSPASISYRFLGQMNPSDDLIRRMTEIDYTRDAAFIALRADGAEKKEIGVSRFCTSEDQASCECAVTVSDEWQGRGLGTLLMRHLIEVARHRGIKRMVSIDMAGNVAMRSLAQNMGFNRKVDLGYPSEVIHTLDLVNAV
ncbi:MAG: GNAT family N-acetyltransferase [Dokdonella sp.]